MQGFFDELLQASSLGREVQPERERQLDLQHRTLTMRLMSATLPDRQTGSKMHTEEKRGKKQWERRERNFKETTLLFHRLGEGLKLSVFTTLLAGLLAAPIVDSLHGRFLAPAPCQQLSLAPLSPPVEWVSRNSFIVHCYILPSIRCSVFVGLRHREDARDRMVFGGCCVRRRTMWVWSCSLERRVWKLL